MGVELRKNYKGQDILVLVTATGERQIANLSQPFEEAYASTRNKIKRYQAADSPVPMSLRWMPGLVNIIDDAQDLLVTALYLGKPILKRAPAPILKAAGYAVTVNDTMNAATNVMATALTPGMKKPKALKDAKDLKSKLKNPEATFNDFVAKGGWRSKLGAILQGAQAADTIFGKGLQLGALMGAISDATWAPIDIVLAEFKSAYEPTPEAMAAVTEPAWERASKVLPNLWNAAKQTAQYAWESMYSLFGSYRSTLELKATRFLLQTPQIPNLRNVLDEEDAALLYIAQSAASGILAEQPGYINDERINLMCILPFPAAKPIKASSVAALEAEGIPLTDTIPILETNIMSWPSIGVAIDQAIRNSDAYGSYSFNLFRDDIISSTCYAAYTGAGSEIINALTAIDETQYTTYENAIVAAAELSDLNITLIPPWRQSDLEVWLTGALESAAVDGRHIPNLQDWIVSAERYNLRWQPKE